MGEQKTGITSGIYAASLTPLNKDLSINHNLFASHCSFLLENGCHGIVLFGTTGEAASFTLGERTDALEQLQKAGVPVQNCLVGTGCCAVDDTLNLSRHALNIGIGGILLLPPYYYKNISDEGLYAYFNNVFKKLNDTHLRVYLYNFPKMTAVPLNQNLIGRLLQKFPESLAGIKDSSGEEQNLKTLHAKFPGFQVFSGNERNLAQLLKIGISGSISATLNVTYGLTAEIYREYINPETIYLQETLNSIRDIIRKYPLVASLKRLLATLHSEPQWLHLRPPLSSLSKSEEKSLFDQLQETGFFPKK